MSKKIGIITWHNGGNFGSVLQALALSSKLCELGYDAEIINYLPSPYGRFTFVRNLVVRILSNILPRFKKRLYINSDSFRKKYMRQTNPLYNRSMLERAATVYDVIVCGSDQIWAPNVINNVYFADFAPKGVRKISYAASIGLNEIPRCLTNVYKEKLKNFYAISIREDVGKELLKSRCDINSSVVIDPTLLYGSTFYEKYEKSIKNIKHPFIFCYFLNDDNHYSSVVCNYAALYKLDIIGISSCERDAKWMLRLHDIEPGGFLWLIHHANCIFTDSYHGTIFSMLYHKRVWTFERFETNDPINQNSRIFQLHNYFGLTGIIINVETKELDSTDIDYDRFEEQLTRLRLNSLNYLEKSLK